MLHQIKAQQFYTDLGLYQQCEVLQKILEFKDFSRLLSKADLIFKDFSRKPSKFKYFSSLCEPCLMLANFFVWSADFFEINIVQNSFKNITRMSNSMVPNQARHFFCPIKVYQHMTWQAKYE